MLETTFFDTIGSKVPENDKYKLLKDADFDFGVTERDIYYYESFDNGGFKRLNNRKVILRKDNGTFLGLTKDCYSPVLMSEALSLFDRFVEEGQLSYEYTGTSYNSKKESLKFWVLLRLHQDYYEVSEGDYLLPYLLLSNSFDGSCGLWLRSTAIRYFCENQTHLLIKEGGDRLHVKHTGKARQRFLANGKEWLDQLLLNNLRTIEFYKRMNDKQITMETFEEYLKKVFPLRYSEDKQWSEHMYLVYRFLEGDEFSNPASLYSAYNTITYLLTHELGSDERTRFYSNNWGSNNSYGNRAFNLALSLLK